MVFITEGATMSDGITEATRYDTAAIQKFRQSIRKEVIESFTTKELVEELCKREGVKKHKFIPAELKKERESCVVAIKKELNDTDRNWKGMNKAIKIIESLRSEQP